MKTLLALLVAVILVATPALSHAYYGGGELAVVLGYLVYLGIAEIVKAVKSSSAEEEGTKATTESEQTEQIRPETPSPKPFYGRCNVLPHTAYCQ